MEGDVSSTTGVSLCPSNSRRDVAASLRGASWLYLPEGLSRWKGAIIKVIKFNNCYS